MLKSLAVLAVLVVQVMCKDCQISTDCQDSTGRSLCYEKICRRDIPCNKDNDCYFYGTADVSHRNPYPKCYDNKEVQVPHGYGVCMLQHLAGNLPRIPGGDPVDVKQDRRGLFEEWYARHMK